MIAAAKEQIARRGWWGFNPTFYRITIRCPSLPDLLGQRAKSPRFNPTFYRITIRWYGPHWNGDHPILSVSILLFTGLQFDVSLLVLSSVNENCFNPTFCRITIRWLNTDDQHLIFIVSILLFTGLQFDGVAARKLLIDRQ